MTDSFRYTTGDLDHNDSESTKNSSNIDLDKTDDFELENSNANPCAESECLFETYERRSVRDILLSRQVTGLNSNVSDSEAAHAAGMILDGVEFPTLDSSNTEFGESNQERIEALAQLKKAARSRNPRPRTSKIKIPRRFLKSQESLFKRALSPGAQFVYALCIFGLMSGLIGLAASTKSPSLVLITGIVSPILLPILIWKWIRWLDSSPYLYRLMTSLGEDAHNLMHARIFAWFKS